MRRRILQSTLIVVTIMGLVLGVPLAFTTWRLVEDVTRAELTGTLEQIAARLDEPGAIAKFDASQVELALPAGGRLVVEQDGRQVLAVGSSELDPARPSSRRCRSRRAACSPSASRTRRCAPSSCRSRWSCCCWSCCRWPPARASRSGPPAGSPSRSPTWPTAPPVSARATSASPRTGTASRSWTACPTCSTPPPVRSPSCCSANATSSATSPTSCAAGSPRCSCGWTSSRPIPIRARRREALAALEQTEKLTEVLDELLVAARAARAAGAEVQDLRAGLLAVADEWRPRCAAPAVRSRCGYPTGCSPASRPPGCGKRSGALVDNAIQHGDGTVTIAAAGHRQLHRHRGRRTPVTGCRRSWCRTCSTAASPSARRRVWGWRWPGRS